MADEVVRERLGVFGRRLRAAAAREERGESDREKS